MLATAIHMDVLRKVENIETEGSLLSQVAVAQENDKMMNNK
jgi:hypothetical protein